MWLNRSIMSKVTTDKFNQIIKIELPSAAEAGIYLQSIDEGKAELVLPLTSDRKAVVDALRGLDRLGFTNIAGGIRTALAGFDASTRPDASRAILLLTDGRSDPTAARETMTEARAQGVAIHSLMLGSDPMGKELLSELAHETGGDFVQVTDSRDLPHLLSALRTTGVEKVTLRLNDWPPIPATLVDGRFTAQMHLSVGENRILATATSFDGIPKVVNVLLGNRDTHDVAGLVCLRIRTFEVPRHRQGDTSHVGTQHVLAPVRVIERVNHEVERGRWQRCCIVHRDGQVRSSHGSSESHIYCID